MDQRLEESEFYQFASDIPDGGSRRYVHCNKNKTMIVSRDGNRVSAHCFRCGGRGFVAEQESFEAKLQRVAQEREADHGAAQSSALPEPRVYALNEWPRDAALWLYKAGFSPSMIAKLGAYWCPDLGRVVLPIMEDGRAVFWQARAVNRKPKILSPKGFPRTGLVAKFGLGDTIVLCEDTLSAFKVGQITEAWSLLGTALLPHPLAELLYRKNPVVVWLDSDEPGQKAATKILRTLRAYGVECRNVVTPMDPKMYSRAQIKEVLSAGCHELPREGVA